MADKTDRRCFLTRGVAGAVGIGAAYGSIEENILRAATQSGAAQPAAEQAQKPKTDIAPGSLPCGKIGEVSISRLLLGGNLIGGWAHSRDLMYASKLFTSYNTEAKIFETLELAQACGINWTDNEIVIPIGLKASRLIGLPAWQSSRTIPLSTAPQSPMGVAFLPLSREI